MNEYEWIARLCQQTLAIGRALVDARIETGLLRHEIDPDRVAAFLLDDKGGIVFANQHGSAMLEAGEAGGALVWRNNGGRCHCALERMQLWLLEGLRAVQHGNESVTLTVQRHAQRFQCYLFAQAVAEGRPIAAVLAVAQVASHAELRDVLCLKLGLTRTEAETVMALHEGLKPAEIATARRVSVHTVRNQIKSALAKTGRQRQSDLVRLVEAARHGLPGSSAQ